MKLVASVMVGPGELDRYLHPCLASLAEFCDEIRVRWEGLGDLQGMFAGTDDLASVSITSRRESTFFENEGRARNELLAWTLQALPTHILAIDADEFVTDGPALRAALEADPDAAAWKLEMGEVWKATGDALWLRSDGGWKPHQTPCLYRVPNRPERLLKIRDAALACGREPEIIRRLWRTANVAPAGLLHFGWTNVAERKARHHRYVLADGGEFHARRHLDSILWPDRRVRLSRRDWPAALGPWRGQIVERANRVAVAV